MGTWQSNSINIATKHQLKIRSRVIRNTIQIRLITRDGYKLNITQVEMHMDSVLLQDHKNMGKDIRSTIHYTRLPSLGY